MSVVRCESRSGAGLRRRDRRERPEAPSCGQCIDALNDDSRDASKHLTSLAHDAGGHVEDPNTEPLRPCVVELDRQSDLLQRGKYEAAHPVKLRRPWFGSPHTQTPAVCQQPLRLWLATTVTSCGPKHMNRDTNFNVLHQGVGTRAGGVNSVGTLSRDWGIVSAEAMALGKCGAMT